MVTTRRVKNDGNMGIEKLKVGKRETEIEKSALIMRRV